MLVFICLENARILLHLLVFKQYMFIARNNHYGTIDRKLDASATSLTRCMKSCINSFMTEVTAI